MARNHGYAPFIESPEQYKASKDAVVKIYSALKQKAASSASSSPLALAIARSWMAIEYDFTDGNEGEFLRLMIEIPKTESMYWDRDNCWYENVDLTSDEWERRLYFVSCLNALADLLEKEEARWREYLEIKTILDKITMTPAQRAMINLKTPEF